MKKPFDLDAIDGFADDFWHAGERVLQAYKVFGNQMEFFLKWADFAPDSLILDMGCGFGELAREAAKYRPSLRVVSLNISEGQLAYCPEPKIKADFQDTGLQSASFDGVACLFSIGHGDVRKVLAEAYRLLVPGGKLLIFDMRGEPDVLWALSYDIFDPFQQDALDLGLELQMLYEIQRYTYTPSSIIPPETIKEHFQHARPALWLYTKP